MSAQRVAVVTGGSGGIGRACGAALVAQGYDVVLTSRRPEPLHAAADEIGARAVPADAGTDADVARLFDAVERCDVLVHAAGVLDGTTVRDQPVDTFDEVLRINLRSSYLVTRAALTKMRAGAKIVYISSVAGLKGLAGMSAYSTSKAGVNALAQSVAAEVERDGIGVHIVVPGLVETEMIDNPATMAAAALTPDHVAEVVAWLCELPPEVVIRQITMRATDRGPFATRRVEAGGAAAG
ncbi:SDR family oxidoreductase [Euzebya sp.]|uniref:SDR family oxidoreductase n=1 Tax=Euzebya sp. TaxID=1971409 RepID=UPI0035120E06